MIVKKIEKLSNLVGAKRLQRSLNMLSKTMGAVPSANWKLPNELSWSIYESLKRNSVNTKKMSKQLYLTNSSNVRSNVEHTVYQNLIRHFVGGSTKVLIRSSREMFEQIRHLPLLLTPIELARGATLIARNRTNV